jgi:hypothetical protein
MITIRQKRWGRQGLKTTDFPCRRVATMLNGGASDLYM